MFLISHFGFKVIFHFGHDYFVEIISLLNWLIKQFHEVLIISIHCERISSQYEESSIKVSKQKGGLEIFKVNFTLIFIFGISA